MVGDSPDIVGEGPISDLGDLEGWWNNHAIVAWSFALFGCFLLNVILLLAFLIRPSLRTISNRFVMNLTVSNLLLCVTMNPLLIMDASTTSGSIVDSPWMGSVCGMSEGAVAIVTTSSVLSVLLIAVDQYFAVVDPLRYRARVDKLKSAILIISIWFISIIFGFLASFNPKPQSLWLSCTSANRSWPSNASFAESFTESFTESTLIAVFENGTDQLKPSVSEIAETFEGTIRFEDDVDLGGGEKPSEIFATLAEPTLTYGFVYAVAYSIFAYFIPFVAVCWIYVTIYVAAHRNSERARRSGSRPILSSASFTEEQNAPRLQRLQTDTIEDFRKLPKISSLSSIDETSETMQPTGQLSRRRSFSSSLEIEASSPPVQDKTSSGIVFTVGLQRLEASESVNSVHEGCANSDSYKSNRDSVINVNNDAESEEGEGEGGGRSGQGQESRNDLEERVAGAGRYRGERVSDGWISRSYVDEDSDSEDEARFECFDDSKRVEETLSSPFYDSPCSESRESIKVAWTGTGDESERNKESVIGSLEVGADEREDDPLRAEDVDSKSGSASAARVAPDLESRHGLSTFVLRGGCEGGGCEGGGYGKTERDGGGTGSGTESSACLLAPIVTITPAPSKNDNLHRVSSVRSTSSYINSLKDRISNGSIFRHREEARAARISALVIVMGLICWSPYVILLLTKNLPRSTDQHLPHKYDVLASGLLILAAYISPLLFGYRSKRVKRELRRFFCFRRELSYKNNRSLMAKKVLKRRHSSTLSHVEMDHKYNIFNCVYGRNRWPKEKVQFVQVPDTALAVETCRSSFSSGASTQISSTSTEEC